MIDVDLGGARIEFRLQIQFYLLEQGTNLHDSWQAVAVFTDRNEALAAKSKAEETRHSYYRVRAVRLYSTAQEWLGQ